MQMLILCGGLGTRLRPLTEDIPKPMLVFDNKPFLQYLIEYYKGQGINEFVLSVGYLKEKIIKYFGNGKKFGVKINYSQENVPLGTGGALFKARKILKNVFFVVNGDTFREVNLNDLRQFYKKRDALCVIGVSNCMRKQNSGFVKFDKKWRIIDFRSFGDTKIGYVNNGIYLMDKRIFEFFPKGKSSLEYDVFSKIKNGLFAYKIQKGYFIDIGTVKTYNQFAREFYKVKNVIGNTLKSSGEN
ncbi:MAG: Nucleoside-diphosphate-sugar pyrophosphorylase, D-glycero-alpha-D-manno-heptose 1-phosphate guanylyltransferase [Candidatus Peregrinibacteria bacterium GW2011_GWF2_38_29]|nr:MAG: Nucleoside-diphosphate-sugar pyrophosphorylase, D-glycero-alpha-D-manno-heptose 1-phosphate guanylyltransferase [Candidatus Peregrinibacteria bacterium GW2011_GWF2_38_29]HBB03198.1 nucleoside-diphosphate-sugar pyrophosphorylase [Candidatus Peregrinibacteria bacterium]